MTRPVAVRAADERSEVTFPGKRAYPESITATADGSLFAGSVAEGGIFRVPPGGTEAARWIAPGAGESMSTFGVLADERSGTLWVCSNDASDLGVPPPGGAKPVALKAFDLRSGTLKASYPLPRGDAFCNDAVVGPDGSVYITDSAQPHVLRLKAGGTGLDVWAEHPDFGNGAVLDGIAFGSDGNVYVNTFKSGQLFRIAVEPDGRAGKVTKLSTSQPLDRPDGLRFYGPGTLLMVEGGGRLDVVHLQGDSARIEVVKDGYKGGPASVVQVGGVAWVLESQLGILFDPKATNEPGAFHAYAVPLH